MEKVQIGTTIQPISCKPNPNYLWPQLCIGLWIMESNLPDERLDSFFWHWHEKATFQAFHCGDHTRIQYYQDMQQVHDWRDEISEIKTSFQSKEAEGRSKL